MAKRTDPHRKGAIIPAEYAHVMSYNLATSENGWPIPAFGIDCVSDRGYWQKDAEGEDVRYVAGKHSETGRCCVIGLREVAKVIFAKHGGPGKCTACGTAFVYGEVWEHTPTGEHVHIGHICGTKYGLLVDRSAFELEAGRRKAAAAVQAQKAANTEARKAFLDATPGLEAALATNHPIVQDIAVKFRSQYTSLTEAQVKLVFKLANEKAAPEACDYCQGAHKIEECPDRKPVEEGRMEVRGRVLGTKTQESQYGTTLKMLVLLDYGSKLWATVPAGLKGGNASLRGAKVKFVATVQRSEQDAYFGFGSRPTCGEVVEEAAQ